MFNVTTNVFFGIIAGFVVGVLTVNLLLHIIGIM